MTLIIGKNQNVNDTAIVSSYAVGNTPVKLASAKSRRTYMHIALDPSTSNVSTFIRLYPATLDNLAKGIVLARNKAGRTSWTMSEGNTYIGEVSAVAIGGTAVIHVTEY